MEYRQRLRDLREDHDLTQQEVAAVIGTSQTMYARYERGANELPIRHLIALAEYYHVSTDYILCRTPGKKKKVTHLPGFALLLAALLLAGCGSREAKHMVLAADELDRIEEKGLTAVDLSGSTCYDAILAWMAEHPDVEVSYTVALPDGTEVRNDAQSLDLSAYDAAELGDAAELIRALPALREVELGDNVPGRTLADVRALSDRFPDVSFRFSAELGGVSVPFDAQSLDLSAFSGDAAALTAELAALPALREAELGSAFSGEELAALRAQLPALRLSGTADVLGTAIALDAESIDLSSASSADIGAAAAMLGCFENVSEVKLGAERDSLGWEDVALVEQLFPEAKIDYSFTLFDRACTLADTEWIFKETAMNDRGEAVRAALPHMKELTYLRMDRCGVDSADMAKLRDDFPGIKVVWRVFFGSKFTCLTDTERILASSPSRGGSLDDRNTAELMYCTEVKYMDIGHQDSLHSLSFCAYMPKLEMLIASIGGVNDLSGLSNCQNLRVLELYKSDVSDLTPLAGLKSLTDLNVSCIGEISDLSPLFGMSQLRYVMVGATRAPKEQIAELKERLPDCEVNDWCLDGKSGWRGIIENGTFYISDRYAEMQEVFDYVHRMYALPQNDPDF